MPHADLLLTFADARLFRPLWSEQILEETRRTLVDRLHVGEDRADRRLDAMRAAFPDAMVPVSDAVIAMMTNDSKDRHVVACAVIGQAAMIVTDNIRHFPMAELSPLGIEAVSTDRFLADQVELAPDVVLQELHGEIWAERHLPVTGISWDDYLRTLLRFPQFHAELLEMLREPAPHLAPGCPPTDTDDRRD